MTSQTGIVGEIDPKKPIKIIGAGISGLLLGYHLKKAGFNIQILEKDTRSGGKIQTTKSEFGLQEHAANAIYTDDNIWELIEELNLDYILPTPRLKKKLYINEQITIAKPNLFQILLILTRIFKRTSYKENISVFDFFSPLLGSKLTSNLVGAGFIGIYASDIKEIHFDSVFKNCTKDQTYYKFFNSLFQLRKCQKKSKTSISFLGGMNDFINALKKELSNSITLNINENDINLENTIICTDAISASKLLKDSKREVSLQLERIEYIPIDSRTIIHKSTIDELKSSFGILFPMKKNRKTLGILNNSAIFKNRVLDKQLNSYTFITQPINDHEQSVEIKQFKLDLDLHASLYNNKVSWDKGLPKYNSKRFETILKLRELLANQNDLALFGNYIDGISIREMNTIAKNFAAKLKNVQ